jgi:hypothetical protein
LNRTQTQTEPVGAGVRRELGIYLNDHLAGATAGTELTRRLAASVSEPDAREFMRGLAAEVAEDRAALLEIMEILGFPVQRYKARAGWLAERVGRLKSNGHLVRRSPLSSLLELEMLRLAVEGKAACWRTLRELTDLTEGIPAARLDELLARAGRQAETLEKLRVRAARNLRPATPVHAGRP